MIVVGSQRVKLCERGFMVFLNGILSIIIGPVQLLIPNDYSEVKMILFGIQIMAFANYIYLLWRDR